MYVIDSLESSRTYLLCTFVLREIPQSRHHTLVRLSLWNKDIYSRIRKKLTVALVGGVHDVISWQTHVHVVAIFICCGYKLCEGDIGSVSHTQSDGGLPLMLFIVVEVVLYLLIEALIMFS